MKRNRLLDLSNKRAVGVYSVCTASRPIIKAALEFARDNNSIIVIEATANQVNQFGGYTGMTPADYRDFVYEIADEVNINKDQIILGGDHLGPLTWTDLDEEEAMINAYDLVYDFAKAGFTKIHLDTSMRLKDDSDDEMLSNETIARRSAIIAKAADDGYEALLEENPDAVYPVFIIGSEVPIPDGAQEEEDELQVTTVNDFIETYNTFEKVFAEQDVQKVFDNVIGIVVQPGVEFGDSDLFIYDHEAAKDLTNALKENFETLVFEGHSTDYQTPEALREMVEDGITILKVGPGLTFAYREALFALANIENILVDDPSNFIEVLESVMLKNPGYWQKHYHGTVDELALKRKYSYSDRARYYLPNEEVDAAINKLMKNLSEVEIPETLLSQYLPYQYRRVKDKSINNDPESLILDYIKLYNNDYEYATHSKEL